MKTTIFQQTKNTTITILTILFAMAFSIQAGIGEGQSATGPLPVELTSFSAHFNKLNDQSSVLLNWTTATEVDNYGFEVQRASTPLSPRAWETLGFVNGHGNSNSPKEYSFVDLNPLNGNSKYRLKQIDTDGKFEYSDIIELKTNLLKNYILEQNYPNPFNPTTVISYSIPTASFVSVKVFDVLGNTIATLVNEHQEVGSYKVSFNASALSNGVYFYKIHSGGFTDIKKMLLLK